MRGPLLRSSGFEIDVDSQSWYFWTGMSHELINALSQIGYHTDQAVRPASQAWKLSRTRLLAGERYNGRSRRNRPLD